MKTLIEKLFPFEELFLTVKRFPLSIVCALGLFVIAVLEIHNFVAFDDAVMGRVVAILSCLYFWFGISRLISESQNLSFAKHVLIALAGAAGIAALVISSPIWWQNLLFLVPAILLTLMFAPYLKGGDDLSVWFFNRMVWFGVAVSYIALLMFAGGVCTALWAVEELFDLNIHHHIFSDIWAFSCLVLGPIYALSWVPKVFEFTEEDCHDPPGLKFIVNWISVPMVLVYLAILYAYFAKVVFAQEIPNGILAYLISGFVGAGVVTYLVSWPLREVGSAQLRLFHKVFFPALIIPVGFHFFAIWERIGAYGLTEQRYFILLTAIWFSILALGNIYKKMPIKAVPATLAILLLFASFGPWGAVSVSGQSQFSRLTALMEKNGILVDGEIVKQDERSVPFEDRKSMSSILDYICRSDRDAWIEAWFNHENKENWSCYGGSQLTEQLGFSYVSSWRSAHDDKERINIWVSHNNRLPIDLSGYDYLVKNGNAKVLNGKTCSGNSCQPDVDNLLEVYREKETAKITFKHESLVLAEHDLSEFLLKHRAERNYSKPLFIDLENERIKLRMSVHSAYGEIKDEKPVLTSLSYDLLYRFKGIPE